MTNKLDDEWGRRDFPVLREAARVLDHGDGPVTATPLMEVTGLTQQEVFSAFDALVPGYLTGELADTLAGRIDVFFAGITERGRRAVGLWPSGESVDALVDVLRQAEEATSDPEEKSAIRRAASAVLGVKRWGDLRLVGHGVSMPGVGRPRRQLARRRLVLLCKARRRRLHRPCTR